MLSTTIVRDGKIIPFPHQLEALEALRINEEKQNTALVLMAGGLGKTILSALYVQDRFKRFDEKRCLYLCHQNDILEQAKKDYQKVFAQEVSYGFFHGDQKVNFDANIIFASFQTLRDNVELYTKEDFDIIVVDETHHAMAETYERTIRYYRPKFLLGISMIGERLDGLDIREIYGKEVYTLPVVDALVRGLLCPIDYRLMSDEISLLKHLDTEKGKISIKKLNELVFVPKRDEAIADIINKNIDNMGVARGMIFCSSIEHTEMISEMIPGSIPIHSGISKVERKLRLELFRKGTFKIAVTVEMFNEGLNVPDLNFLVFLRSTTSPAIFYSQLLRGSRIFPGKEKVLVLDFVANCERVLTVYDLWTKTALGIKVLRDKKAVDSFEESSIKKETVIGTETQLFIAKQKIEKEVIEPFSLNVDDVSFKEKIIPIIERVQKIREPFYLTWQEAAFSAKNLGITSWYDYIEKYSSDPKLPSNPQKFYSDFPGFDIFLRNSVKVFYVTWQEAGAAAAKLGIANQIDYQAKYKLDNKLPADPNRVYKDYPGLEVFLGILYQTWEEASEASIKLGIKTSREYLERYREDPKLRVAPSMIYEDFPGFEKFLGKVSKEPYTTWQEASNAAIALDIKSRQDYQFKKMYKEDPKLLSNPERYEDFPGWDTFLNKK